MFIIAKWFEFPAKHIYLFIFKEECGEKKRFSPIPYSISSDILYAICPNVAS